MKTQEKNTVITVNNAQVKVGKIVQTANEEFGVKDKTTYAMLVITDKGQHKMSVGEETYNKIKEITA